MWAGLKDTIRRDKRETGTCEIRLLQCVREFSEVCDIYQRQTGVFATYDVENLHRTIYECFFELQTEEPEWTQDSFDAGVMQPSVTFCR
jgi:hypothetical protein